MITITLIKVSVNFKKNWIGQEKLLSLWLRIARVNVPTAELALHIVRVAHAAHQIVRAHVHHTRNPKVPRKRDRQTQRPRVPGILRAVR